MKIIGITGKSGSGKTTVASLIAKKMNGIHLDIDKIGHEALLQEDVIKKLCNNFGTEILNENGPMLTTSVNESGDVPLNEYDQIYLKYNNVVDKIYKSNHESSNISSTVVLAIDEIKILREGEISYSDIINV